MTTSKRVLYRVMWFVHAAIPLGIIISVVGSFGLDGLAMVAIASSAVCIVLFANHATALFRKLDTYCDAHNAHSGGGER